jgi:hypothetical protein
MTPFFRPLAHQRKYSVRTVIRSVKSRRTYQVNSKTGNVVSSIVSGRNPRDAIVRRLKPAIMWIVVPLRLEIR